MLFFPNIYPDELLYSVICRYAARKCEVSYKHLMMELFGSKNFVLNYDLPSNLNILVNCIKEHITTEITKLIYETTLYPYYSAFVEYEKAEAILDLMKNGCRHESVRSKSGIVFKLIPRKG